MDRLKSMGGVSPELMEQAKQAMLAENMDFSEQSEPSKRSGAGYPSLGGYIETHYDFAQASPDLASLQKQLKAAITSRDSGRRNSSQERIDMLRGKIKQKLKLDKIAKEETLRRESDMDVYQDPRGDSDSDYAEEGDTRDFTTCQRPDGSYYGSRGRCIKGSESSLSDRKGAGKKKEGGGGGNLVESAKGTSVPGPRSANPGKIAKSAASELEKKTGQKLTVQAPVRISKTEVMSAFTDNKGKAYMANMSHDGKGWNIDNFKGIG